MDVELTTFESFNKRRQCQLNITRMLWTSDGRWINNERWKTRLQGGGIPKTNTKINSKGILKRD